MSLEDAALVLKLLNKASEPNFFDCWDLNDPLPQNPLEKGDHQIYDLMPGSSIEQPKEDDARKLSCALAFIGKLLSHDDLCYVQICQNLDPLLKPTGHKPTKTHHKPTTTTPKPSPTPTQKKPPVGWFWGG